MVAIIEESSAALVIDENVGNTGNSAPTSSNNRVSDVVDLHPNNDPDTGNQWEQTGVTINVSATDDLPAIPDQYKVLDIDGETTHLSDQWIYRDSVGKILFYVQRFNTSTGRKEFRPLMPLQNGKRMKWQRKAPNEPRPLYGLHRLDAKPNAEVMVCEGEKAADAAAQLFPNMVSVCSMNGANSPDKSDWSPLAGRTVFLWGDFDEPGNKYIANVERLTTIAGANVVNSIQPEWFLQMGTELGIEQETLPKGWDAADAKQEGFTAENIQTFLHQEKHL